MKTPVCCRAAILRAKADAMWETDHTRSDTLEARAVGMLLREGLPTSRKHDVTTCELRIKLNEKAKEERDP